MLRMTARCFNPEDLEGMHEQCNPTGPRINGRGILSHLAEVVESMMEDEQDCMDDLPDVDDLPAPPITISVTGKA